MSAAEQVMFKFNPAHLFDYSSQQLKDTRAQITGKITGILLLAVCFVLLLALCFVVGSLFCCWLAELRCILGGFSALERQS